jgi:hypothetical protein
MMFVVPIEALSQGMGGYSETYAALLQFVGERAIDPEKSESFPMEKRDYVIFVFLRDRISPSSKLEVKISGEKAGTRGYKDSTSYIDFDGWRVALLPGRLTLFDNSGTAPLHLKTVFTPGAEVPSLRRAPTVVGLFHLDGTIPEP